MNMQQSNVTPRLRGRMIGNARIRPHLIDVTNPKPDDFSADWLAVTLGNIARFGGNTNPAYAVADHCATVADQVYAQTNNATTALYALLHDAHESVIGDIPTPIKFFLGDLGLSEFAFRRAVEKIDAAIFAAFDLAPMPDHVAEIIESVDRRMLITECRDLYPFCQMSLADLGFVGPLPEFYPFKIAASNPETARARWLGTAAELCRLADLNPPAMHNLSAGVGA